MSAIQLRALSKFYGPTPVLQAIDLTVSDGSITAVLGASGSGKTTLLRIIAGFEDADSGRVSIGDAVVDDGNRTVRPQHRGVGYVPQDAALFPHLTVAANVGFGVGRRQRARLSDLIDLVGLTGLEHRYPYQLSGGQQQRVALARALAIKPNVVLLDEPFGSLDAALRESVRTDVAAILTRTGTTTVLVTHDQDEALSMADNVILLRDGRVLAQGHPRELYDHPPSPDVAVAIGLANILDGQVRAGRIYCHVGTFPLPVDVAADPRSVQVMLRPEQIVLETSARPGHLPAAIDRLRYHGHDTLIDLTPLGNERACLTARVAGETSLQTGQQVWLTTTATPHVWL